MSFAPWRAPATPPSRTPSSPSSRKALSSDPANEPANESPMTGPGTIGWLALHEARLSWRDWLYLITGGHSRRALTSGIVFVGFVIFLHGLAYLMLGSAATDSGMADKQRLTVITGTLAMS